MRVVKISRDVMRILAIIKQEKNRQGYTWEQLAQRTGVSPLTLNHWFDKTHAPTMETCVTVLNGLGLELCVRRKKPAKSTDECTIANTESCNRLQSAL